MIKPIDQFLGSLINDVDHMVKTYKYIDNSGTEKSVPVIKPKEI